MTRILSVANQKGGVGKTTISLQIIYALLEAGHKVLAIDFDGQGNLSSRLTYEERVDGVPIEFNGTRTVELYQEEDFEIKPTICKNGAHLIHAEHNDPELFEIGSKDINVVLNPSVHIAKIADQYDYIIVDCPPSLGHSLLAALTMSTHVVTIVKVAGLAVDGAEGLMSTVIGVQETTNPSLKSLGFLINMHDGSTTHTRSYDQLKEELDDLIFDNPVRYRTPIDTATSLGIPVKNLNYAHVAAREVQNAIDELIQRIEAS